MPGSRADVSRTFLYGNPEARTAVATAMAEAGERRSYILAERDDERDATWRERALNAEDALKAAHAEILAQRASLTLGVPLNFATHAPGGPVRRAVAEPSGFGAQPAIAVRRASSSSSARTVVVIGAVIVTVNVLSGGAALRYLRY
ncbi:hypothetical protein [Streptomyces halobius]|uniref:Uncharacterized protein n=1 Tax=Streptomyces halobius TaxID=2879846 RepID=A0ABY4M535_9ACTN|nr:hypothetical protein [Streptomyces halobius]UQA91346.1 hypothetical protein K9S39_05165 [Streptomyces halobius]